MTREELTLYNLGENLDSLMNLDPRGYGVCRILYEGSRKFTGEPLSTHVAKGLVDNIKENDLVYIITGFVLLPWKKAEMDGIVSSMLLARFLIKAFGATPVVIVPSECELAVKRLASFCGIHLYDSIKEAQSYPASMAYVIFTKDKENAEKEADDIIKNGLPSAVISNEAPGRNIFGEYHNAVGKNTTEFEAKYDVLFEKLKSMGVYNVSIGDLGNEIGMNTIGEHIKQNIPYANTYECNCSCKGGILVKSKADNIITATVSDWGCNAMMAATAFVLKRPECFHTEEIQMKSMEVASRAGMLDMYGWMIPSIDGFGKSINLPMVSLMRELILYPKTVEDETKEWFNKTIEKGFFER